MVISVIKNGVIQYSDKDNTMSEEETVGLFQRIFCLTTKLNAERKEVYFMAELLIKRVSATHNNPDKDQRGCYKSGMIVEIRPDGCIYGTSEGMPTFWHIKIPSIPVNHPILLRLTEQQQAQEGLEPDGITPRIVTVRRRKCQLLPGSIPQAALNILESTGELTIKATAAYTGPYDYTWTQVKNYFWNHQASANDFTDELE